MLSFLFGLVDPISRIAGKIADARIASVQASTDKEQIAADERVKALEARKSVMVAESGGGLNPVMRAVLSVPAAYALYKVFLFGAAFSPNEWGYIYAVIGFYFITSIVATAKR